MPDRVAGRSRVVPALAGCLAIGALMAAATAPATAQSPAAARVTFTEHVAPILFANCTTCHRPGEAAPFTLMSYDDARRRGRLIAAVTGAGVMPPWKAAPGDYAFANERRLSAVEIDQLRRWVEDGMPKGDPDLLPPLPTFTDGWELGPPDLVVTMPEPFAVPADGPDVYRNFVIPLNLDADTWVRAVDFRPSARAVVHHSLFFLDQTGAARQRDEQDPGPGFEGAMGGGVGVTRGGGAGLRALMGLGGGRGRRGGGAGSADGGAELLRRGGSTLGGWALGGRAQQLPDDLAFFLPRGSDLILSTHFHPSGKPEEETSTVGLYFADRPPTKAFAPIQLPPVFGALEGIDIPAGERGYTISDSFVLPVEVEAFGVTAHAHYLGREMELAATLPDGARRTLLRIDDWDFSWQETYRFTEFVRLPPGTRLDVTITYDNSADNPRNPSRPPVPVTWGEESTDEMGSMSLQIVPVRPGDLVALQQAYAGHVRQAALTRPGLAQLIRRGLERRTGGSR
jgi:hypothetical protein